MCLDLCQLRGLEPLLWSGSFSLELWPCAPAGHFHAQRMGRGILCLCVTKLFWDREPLFGVCTHQEKYQCSEEGLPSPSRSTEASLVVEKWNVPANEEQLRDGWATILAAGCCLSSSPGLLLEVQTAGRAASHSTFWLYMARALE